MASGIIDMEQSTFLGQKRCSFIFVRKTKEFQKGDQCTRLALEASEYCCAHQKAVSKREARQGADIRKQELEQQRKRRADKAFRTVERQEDRQRREERRTIDSVRINEREVDRQRRQERRSIDSVRIIERDVDRQRRQKRRTIDSVRITEREVDRQRRQERRTNDNLRIVEREANRERMNEHRMQHRQRRIDEQRRILEEGSVRRQSWPQTVSETGNWSAITGFLEATALERNQQAACAVCDGLEVHLEVHLVDTDWLLTHVDLLRVQPEMKAAFTLICEEDPTAVKKKLEPLDAMILSRKGLQNVESLDQAISASVCKRCYQTLERQKLPARALANDLHPGRVPASLESLSLVEEQFIALYRCKVHVVSLVSHAHDNESRQRAIRGNCITFAQNPGSAYRKLPAPATDVAQTVLVIFTGYKKPTPEEMSTIPYLMVRRNKIRDALVWLRENNGAYASIDIDEEVLEELPDAGVPQEIIDMAQTRLKRRRRVNGAATEGNPGTDDSKASAETFSADDSTDEEDTDQESTDDDNESEIVRTGVVDINATGVGEATLTSSVLSELERAVSQHVLLYPHATQPTKEFGNSDLIAGIFPTLFPYGIGKFESPTRRVKISFESQLAHMLVMGDRRFAQHGSFMFVCFNMMQRHKACVQARLIMNRPRFRNNAERITGISKAEVMALLQQQAGSDQESANVRELQKHIKILGSNIPGSVYSKLNRRNEIRWLTGKFGPPALFITINPSDLHSPLLLHFAGYDAPVDLQELNTKYSIRSRARIVAENPVAATMFFDKLITSVLREIFGYGKQGGGIFGHVAAYYGMIESQCRGSLHWHGLLWLSDVTSPEELHKKCEDSNFVARQLQYMDSVISAQNPVVDQTVENVTSAACPVGSPSVTTSTVTNDHAEEAGSGHRLHPCLKSSPKTPSAESDGNEISEYKKAFQDDLNALLKRNGQIHRHSATCHKYGHNECRFRFPFELVENTVYDDDDGRIILKRTHEMVNQFNLILTSCVRCNTDVKWIAMGKNDFLALLYYVTNYITKGGVNFTNGDALRKAVLSKAACAAEMAAANNLEKARSMVLKCFIATASQQEISAPQVAALILKIGKNGECYSSHDFVIIYLGGLVNYLIQCERTSGIAAMVPREQNESMETEQRAHMDDGQRPDADEAGEDMVLEDADDDQYVMSNLRLDYVYRGRGMDDVCLYNFKAHYKKVRSRRRIAIRAKYESFGLEDEDSDDDAADSGTRRRGRPPNESWELLEGHPQHATHIIRRLENPLVPVLIGKAIPSRENEAKREEYCMMILLVFKPWRVFEDLKRTDQSWADSFEEWRASEIAPDIVRTIDNIELLHKAKVHALEDAAARMVGSENSGRAGGMSCNPDVFIGPNSAGAPEEVVQVEHLLDPGIMDADELLDAFERQNDEYVTSAIAHLTEVGIFRIPEALEGCEYSRNQQEEAVSFVDSDRAVGCWLSDLELQCRQRLLDNQESTVPNTLNPQVLSDNGNGMDVAGFGDIQYSEASLQSLPTVAEFGHRYNLNRKQLMAFERICNHLHETITGGINSETQLLMLIVGEAGTGKTRTLNAVIDYFRHLGKRHLVRVAAPTGSAALNLNGSTIHSMINKRPSKESIAERDLIITKHIATLLETELRNIKYLIIDEFSMCGAKLFGELQRALCIAKSCTTPQPAGGINVILAGDLLQFDPVFDRPLYAIPRNGSRTSDDAVAGFGLYHEFKECVMLDQQCRQTDQKLHGMLKDLRNECWDPVNTKILNRQLLKDHWSTLENSNERLTYIVRRNDLRHELNTRLLHQYAQHSGKPIRTVTAVDTCHGQPVNQAVANVLQGLDDAKTRRLAQMLEVADGCPVLLTQNIATELGLVNGSMGTFRKLAHNPGSKAKLRIFAIVEFESYNGRQLQGLQEKCVPIEPITRQFTVRIASSKYVTVTRCQLPLVPAFAITDYRAQGQTLQNVCIDLVSGMRKGNHASQYVMLSRVRELSSLFIMRPFPPDNLLVHLPRELKDEMKRLKSLAQSTEERYDRITEQ